MKNHFFVIFPAAGNRKKKRIIIIMKKKMVHIWKGYCPNRIVRKYFVLQESGLYCRDLDLNSFNCIAGIV